jgi:hypothetical protein
MKEWFRKHFVIHEGEKMKGLINIRKAERTALCLLVRIPLFVWILCRRDFQSGDYFSGPHILWFNFYFRVRDKKQFPADGWDEMVKNSGELRTKYIFHFSAFWEPVRESCQFISEEELWDLHHGVQQ